MRLDPKESTPQPASTEGDCEARNHMPPSTLAVRIAEAASIMGVSESTVDRWRRASILPSARIGGVRLFRVADLHRLLDMHTECGEGGAE
jgi:excisionase family DNA binding protein